MPVEPIQVILGGVLGFASAAALRWWQYRRDLWISEIERFTDTLDDACELSTEHWLAEKPEDTDAADRDKLQELVVQEAKLLGLQIRLDGLLACFISRLLREDRRSIGSKMSALSDALTGGEFQSRVRKSDPDRAQLIQASAADLLIDLRQSVRRTLSLTGTIKNILEKTWILSYNTITMRHNKKKKLEI